METVSNILNNIEKPILQLEKFLNDWDYKYREELKLIKIFNPDLTKKFSLKQKQYFAKVFYHVRGHFHNFLWFIGNHATTERIKSLVLENIAEEFGGNSFSHEKLYYEFALDINADLDSEIVENKNYCSFAKEFNSGHILWLMKHDDASRMAAFSAYERLDNIDYSALLSLVDSFKVTDKAKIFFIVHNKACHFERLSGELIDIWHKSESKVSEAFDFIFHHQLKMWHALSDSICKHV